MRRTISALATCLLLSGMLFAGCGGGNEASSTANTNTAASNGEAGESRGEAGGKESSTKGESGGGTQQAAPKSKAEFVAMANALCEKQRKQSQAKLSEIFKGSQETEQPSSQQAGMRQIADEAVAPAMEAEAEELRALGAPSGDEEQVEAIATALESVAAEAREDPKAFVMNPNAMKKSEAAADAYGIGACGRVN